MIHLRMLSIAAVLALSASVSLAQNAKPAPAPEKAAAQPRECDKPKHDHGADKGTPTPKSVRCAAEENKGKKVGKAHDHNKVHK
jgi:hypothetical protein